ncbi:MAG: ABC transporter permease [Clostridiales bacterium]|jgi:putative ABC transport system permease protein|nr:ABC transporter permease [Eubacteriales bacterium]MDH7564940.1 ABC transporter permease [Clostridiales bacterium]
MGFIQAYKMAIKSILGNKGRSFLTMLGVIIGVGAVIAAVSFAQGSTKNITDSVQGMGTNLIQIMITGRNSNRNVTYSQLQKLAEENSDIISAISPTISSSVKVKVGNKTGDTTLLGTNAEYESVKNMHVQRGRFLMSFDVDYMQKVALVGTALVSEVFEGSDPLGKTIKINGQEFTVVGVLEETDNGQDQSADDTVVIPVTVAQRLTKNAVIRSFAVQAATPETVDAAMEKLNTFLTAIYKDTKTFRVFNQAQMLQTLSTVTGTMTFVLAGIAAISLIVGGIGIMNIMLVSVTERTREIGIRKAIGAKRKSILVQFLIEALVVTGIGGIMGILFGVAVVKIVAGGLKIIPEVYSIPWIVMSFVISLAIGVVFGMFPAYKAAKLNPIEALRFE